MSVRLFYVDESWDEHKFCLTAIGIRHNEWRNCHEMIMAHKKSLAATYGLYTRHEIHARDFVKGRGNVGKRPVLKGERVKIYRGLLELIASLPSVVLLNVCLPQKGKPNAEMTAWNRLLTRIDTMISKSVMYETVIRKIIIRDYLSAVKRGEKRMLDYHPKAIIVADQGQESEIRKAYRRMTVFNPVPSKLGGWPSGEYKNFPLQNIIEDPVFRESGLSMMIQLADCVAFALLKRESKPTEFILKYEIHTMFDECLASKCNKKACAKDPLGIVRA